MGAYSATAPYNCPKSSLILTEGAQWVFNNETSGRYSFGALSLLATGNSAYATRVRNEARARVPNATTRAQMMSDTRDATSMITWERGHTLVFLAEYYLASGDSPATRDAQVLPGIEAYAVNIAKNSSLFGTVGHIFADKFSDGSPNGPMGGVYGPVNSSGMPCFLGLLLARECGITHPSIQPAIDRASLFFASYAGRGAIPYGEHEPLPPTKATAGADSPRSFSRWRKPASRPGNSSPKWPPPPPPSARTDTPERFSTTCGSPSAPPPAGKQPPPSTSSASRGGSTSHAAGTARLFTTASTAKAPTAARPTTTSACPPPRCWCTPCRCADSTSPGAATTRTAG
jgi:hypothetical protein